MPSRIDSLLNPSIGIADLLPMPDAAALPEARDLGTNLLQESGLENLFRTANSRSALEALLCPDIGDGSLVSPEIFEADLHVLLEKLRKSRRFRRSFAKKSNRSCRTVFCSPPTAI